ncbi:MAG TPA: UDP-N-acetylmuramate--L-alanine ligase [Bacteroidales bacterium]|nr:UDP-N-acetylmuramate--L-alanine ligase [Bacteroidales bacterium]
MNKINNVYFLGIGGIGMSALARYFHIQGKTVGGYDLTATKLTSELTDMGMKIHFVDDIDCIPGTFSEIEDTLVVYTPAIPEENLEYQHFRQSGFRMMKRAQVLGTIFNQNKGVAIAGTHGKTSVSTFTAFLLEASGVGCTAFLGGISKNFKSNLVLGASDYIIAEADEFDRSFLQLFPHLLLVTTVDADHLDIYSGMDDIISTFNKLITQVDKGATVILHNDVNLVVPETLHKRTYSLENPDTDYYASELTIKDGAFHFSLNTPQGIIEDLQIGIPGRINVENAIGAMAVCLELGAKTNSLKAILPKMQGAVRRFDIKYKSSTCVYIDDYAHHPRELDAVISSVRELYPGKKITVVFQPHLYSRTKDFADEFAASLSKADELLLLDIYPAREQPLPGVTSDIIFEKVTLHKKQRCSKVNLLSMLKELNIEVLLTLGAGDIDQYVELIKQFLPYHAEA